MQANLFTIDNSDAHDRFSNLLHQNVGGLQKQVESIIQQDPFDGRSFYIFAHRRKGENIGDPDVIIWQPRLLKPTAQTNSMLFRVDPKKQESVEIVWMIPPREQWGMFVKKGEFSFIGLIQNQTISDSIYYFENNRKKLESPHKDDPTEAETASIYRQLYPNLFQEKPT